MTNEPWLSAAIELVNKSIDISKTDYKSLIWIFYEIMSNRNLAKFISILYKKDRIDVYFEIDNIIAQKIQNDRLEEIQDIMKILQENGFNEWLTTYD